MHGLLQSRKFLLLCLDTTVSIILTALAMFLQESYPQVVEFARFLILALQPVFVAVIGGIALEDAAAKRANGFPKTAL